MRNYSKNIRPFTAISDCNFGRRKIVLNKMPTDENVVELLNKCLPIHSQNADEIAYLNRYYEGDQPILYRTKEIRPEVNNKIVVNLAFELVERKVADMFAEPMQYVLRGTDERKSDEITRLNVMMETEDKQECDVEIGRWRSICGTAYRFVGEDGKNGDLLDETGFYLTCEDPGATFVAYNSNDKPVMSCQIRKNEDDMDVYHVYTRTKYYVIENGEIIQSGVNGNFAIPVVEYPNNSRRLSDVEITILVTDAINKLQSDRINGVEQFVSSFIKFVNCEVDEDSFRDMRRVGAIKVTSNNGDSGKADVDIMTSELDQEQGQIIFDDLFEKFLSIQGLSNRQGNGSGDTAGAVQLRNGHYDNGLRTAINEPILKKSERQMLRIVLNKLRIKEQFSLTIGDVEIHINHNKMDNMLTKAEVLKILLECGVYYKRAIKEVDMFSDPEQVAAESKERMEKLYSSDVITSGETDIQVTSEQS